jgi:hypothetical protein
MEVLNNYFIGLESVDNIDDPTSIYYKPKFINEYLSETTSGYGKLFVSNETESYVFNGQIVDGKMSGSGYIKFINDKRFPDHKSYSGTLSNGQFHGTGTILYDNGNTFIGTFTNGKKNGAGKMYNSNGDLIMDNIWKNDVICGKVKYNEKYHGTKQLKLTGVLYNSIKVGTWIHYRENGTVSLIEYYKDYDSEVLDIQSESNQTMESILEKIIETHDSGYIIKQLINPNKESFSIEELCLSNFKTHNTKLLFDMSKMPKNTKEEKNSLDKNTNCEIAEFHFYDSDIKNYAVPLSLENNSLIYTMDAKGSFVSVKECINGILYDKILSLPNFCLSGDSNNNSISQSEADVVRGVVRGAVKKVSKKTNSENCPKQYFLINNNRLDEKTNEVSTIQSIFVVDYYDDVQIPMLYYEGTISNNLPHGNGSTYSNGILTFSGTFDKGQLVNGMQFITDSSNSSTSYLHYNGGFKNNIPHGEGIYFAKNGNKIYEGEINEGKYHGNGISYWETTGVINWNGKWKNHQKHGKGKLYDDSGALICNCTFEHDNMTHVE